MQPRKKKENTECAPETWPMMVLTAPKSSKSCNTEQLLLQLPCRVHAGYDGLNSAVIKLHFAQEWTLTLRL